MRCRTIKYIYLNESELTSRERKKLEQHLQRCPACKAKVEELSRQSTFMSSLKKEPSLQNPSAFTNDILRTIRRSKYELHHHEDRRRTLLDVLTSRGVRFAFGSAFLFLFALFCLQEAKILKRLYHLENRMAQQTASSTPAQRLPFNVRERINKMNSNIDKDQIVIDKEALESLLQSYDNLKIENKLLKKLLEEKSLSQAGVTLDDGLTRDELRTLVNYDDLLKKFYNL